MIVVSKRETEWHEILLPTNAVVELRQRNGEQDTATLRIGSGEDRLLIRGITVDMAAELVNDGMRFLSGRLKAVIAETDNTDRDATKFEVECRDLRQVDFGALVVVLQDGTKPRIVTSYEPKVDVTEICNSSDNIKQLVCLYGYIHVADWKPAIGAPFTIMSESGHKWGARVTSISEMIYWKSNGAIYRRKNEGCHHG